MVVDVPRATLTARPAMGFGELVLFLAATMALNALAIDVVLPALPQMGADLAVTDPNHNQLVVVVYLIGMGASQLVHGPLADRYGRRVTLLVGLVIYSLAALVSALASSFTALIVGRILQGIGAGSPRVVAMSIARDRYHGTEMARVMSLVMMVFMVVPVLAPSLGQAILLVAPWRWIFGVLTVAGVVISVWTVRRLAETLRPEHRRPLSPRAVARAYAEVLSTRATVVPTLAATLAMGSLMAFVTSSQQVFQEVLGAGRAFPLLFAVGAITMSIGSFFNSRLVRRMGPARLARRALHSFIATAAVLSLLACTEHIDLVTFEALQCVLLLSFGFVGANLNALAMAPMGHLAGTASSAIGAVTSIGAAALGGVIGQQYDGTVRPLVLGSLALGVAARAVLVLSPPAPATSR